MAQPQEVRNPPFYCGRPGESLEEYKARVREYIKHDYPGWGVRKTRAERRKEARRGSRAEQR